MRIPASGREPCVPTEANGTAAVEASEGVFTLLANKTYYAALGGEDASQMSVLLAPANALLVTSLTFEVTNLQSAGDLDVTGKWQNFEPGDLAATVSGTVVTDAGNFPLSKTNGAGSGGLQFPTFPWRRGRLKIQTGATGGDLGLTCQAKG